MAEPKKISFGFSKSSKQQTTKINKPVDVNIQYIDCLDSKSIKIKGLPVGLQLEKAEAEIVIPLSTTSNKKNNRLAEIIKSVRGNDEIISTDCDQNQPNDLDSIAARELIAEARNSHHEKKEDTTTIALPLQNRGDNIDEESTLDDYEAVPVSKYGAAMLRGMGWNPAKGIGKNEKVVATFEPKVRPRGMGLGVVLEKSSVVPSMPKQSEEETKGSYVQVTTGPHRDMYGQIEGYNEETGRLILKLALGGTSLSMNEYMVKSVTKDEFTKNSRVLNASKYQEYKSNETRDTTKQMNGFAHPPKNDRVRKERTTESSGSRSRSRSRSPTRKHRYK